MPVFRYQAINKARSTVEGLVDAATETVAADLLKEKGLVIISIAEEKKSFDGKFNINFDRIKPKDIAMFSRQFSVLVSANVALVQALRIMVDQTDNQKLKAVISEISEEVDGGARLSDSLQKREKIFSTFYVSVVKSGETSGKLDEVLNYLADELEKDYDMMSKIRGAMIYPAFVFCGLGVVGVVMMVFVVPKLTNVLAETGAELPMATKILMAVSAFLAGYWWLLGIGIAGAVAGYKYFASLPFGKRIIDTTLLRLPVFGRLFQRIYLVRFTRSLQTLLVGGVNISKALQIAAEIVTNYVYKEMILATKKSVEDGNSISSVFVASPVIPKMVSQMLSIGEKTGRLDVILERVTDFYSREINNTLANLMTLMEPIIMVIIGIAVGIMVAAIIMPMYNMASTM